MARRARHQFTLPTGTIVGYSFKTKYGYFRVRFPHPTDAGKYIETATGVEVPPKWVPGIEPPANAHTEAAKLVLRAYSTTLPPDPKKVTWDIVLADIANLPNATPETVRDYAKTINNLRTILPETRGPAEITPELAARFKRLYASTPFVKTKRPGAKKYKRSSTTVSNALRKLTSLWSAHLKELGYTKDNPWLNITRPDVPTRPVTIPDESSVEYFLAWLHQRYPTWELVHLWVTVKMLAGCRTLDLCHVRSNQLADGSLSLTQTKTKLPRTVPLPADIFKSLDRIKGREWLWEGYTADAKKYRPGTRYHEGFEPSALYWCISNIFREYNEQHPDRKVKPHDLRKRAITLTVLATQSVDQTADAIGLDAQTARRYYRDVSKSSKAKETLARMADVLRPKSPPQNLPVTAPESELARQNSGAILGR